MQIPQFDFDPRTRVVFGQGTLARLGDLVAEFGGSKILLVSDQGLKDAGHEDRAKEYLAAAGLDVAVFDDVQPNPTSDDIEKGVAFARDAQIDFIVGLGGGSSMDCAKGINFLLTNGGKMSDYKGVGKATKPMLPLIAIPTTSGTGSEAQSFAVVADPKTHMKMACGDKKAAAKVAILDPDLTLTMPRSVRAATGVDAISHAVESYVTLKRGPVSQLFSRQAWSLLSRSFLKSLLEPQNVDANGAMLLGAHFAGAAIENSMLGATHALANPLSAHCNLTHGIAIGVLLPHVVRFNGALPEIANLYGHLAEEIGLCENSDPEAPAILAEYLTHLVQKSEQPGRLRECNVDESLFEKMASEASEQWTGQSNPRPVDASSLLELYKCAY
ncbi:iron-containing alcohol dehydrogenase [Thalassoglobus polymorphus]|uniref:NAD-dependent methanol dehydrogenase n=1 Tax=Thalassoglobus polymorphus TaxID=2527994 RepID=A0A517QJ00_9PLAN|nr:iron-containing alcohol dehydrogenase [Thalassoglobus polymorphus]QDT31631.1 NAD-dependent methanol dehydrogenase [Thalassoglobus polymorphus]